MRVLMACSDASIRDAFLDALRRADIGVVPVADAAATLELARQHRPDGSIGGLASARSSRAPPDTSAGESRPRRCRALFAP
jgi:hypothetical protein